MTRTSSTSGECSSPSIAQGRTPEMSLYDRERKPHKLLSDNTEVVISPRSLDSELMCPICLDMLSTTMTTKEYLHRFCLECITTALRNGNKECPTCRKKLVSKRSLRADPNFDALIAKIYPNREEYDAIQERAFAKLSAHSSSKAFQNAMEEGTKHQAQLRKMKKVDPRDFEYVKRSRKRKTEAGADGAGTANGDAEGESLLPHPGLPSAARQLSFDGEERESSEGPSASEASAPRTPGTADSGPAEVELILRPHPNLDADPAVPSPLRATRYLKTTGNATVDHIAEYVALRVRLDTEESQRNADGATTAPAPPTSAFQILVNPGIGSNKPFTLLSGGLSLAEVRGRYWKVKRPLELQFSLHTAASPTNDEGPKPSPASQGPPPQNAVPPAPASQQPPNLFASAGQ